MITYLSIAIGIVIFYFFYKNMPKDSIEKPFSTNVGIGMYFMDQEKKVPKSEVSQLLKDFYYLLGCASQGRTDEIKDIYKEAKKENLKFYNFLMECKPRITIMSRISKQIEDSDIGNDLKNGESIGEYQSRKLMKRKLFMDEFNYFNNLDLQTILINLKDE